MELATSIFIIIMSILSAGGLFVNNSLTEVIERRSQSVEEANVRLTSVPTHQLLQGKADGIQLNLQKWEPRKDIKIELLQLETDPLDLNFQKLRRFNQLSSRNWRTVLNAPLNAGWRLEITEADLNQLFQSSEFQSAISKISDRNSEIDILELSCDFQEGNRLVLNGKIKLEFRGEEELDVSIAFDLDSIKGHTFKINDIKGTLNNRKLSSKLLQGFADNINNNLNLRSLEKSGITLRLLQFDIKEDNMTIAGFIHIKPQSP